MSNKTSLSLIVIISLFVYPLFAIATQPEDTLVIENAWIAEAPPVSKVMVSYMTLKNTGPEKVEIINAASEQYSSIEFHETIHKDGMAMMIRHEKLIIPAAGKLEMKRGGPHLMLFNPVKPLIAGDTVSITFTTSDNTSVTVLVTVKKAQ